MLLPPPQYRGKRIGQIMIAEGFISEDELQECLAEQRRHGDALGEWLMGI